MKHTKLLTKAPKPLIGQHRSLSEAISIATQGWRPGFALLARRKAASREIRLRREGIYNFKETIHKQPGEWLIKKFGPGRKYPVNVNKLIKNIIWQTRTQIIKGQHPAIEGNLRNFWYTHIKSSLFRAGSLGPDVDQYPQIFHL